LFHIYPTSVLGCEKSTFNIYALKLVPFDVVANAKANAKANANYIINGK